jgi:legumain
VIDSGPEDTIFFYFADHGAPGLVAMPNGNKGGYLYEKNLTATIKEMHEKKAYKQFLIYIEACESGSMGEHIPSDIGVFMTTAATSWQSSYAWYMDEKRKTYLADEYSKNWMEDADKEAYGKWDLLSQFERVSFLTNKSEPQYFGDMTIGKEDLSAFMGAGPDSNRTIERTPTPDENKDMPSCRDVDLYLAQHRLRLAATEPQRAAARAELAREQDARARTDRIMRSVLTRITPSAAAAKRLETFLYHKVPDTPCLQTLVEGVEEVCGQFTDFGLKWVRPLVNVCVAGYSEQEVMAAVESACHSEGFRM